MEPAVLQHGVPINKGRVEAKGRFLFAGNEKCFVRGVTYGPFGPDGSVREYPDPACVERDFAQMTRSGLNAVRTYTVPPRWLLDIARHYGLRVMIGLPWEQHVTFLDDRRLSRSIVQRVSKNVRACRDHPAILCYAVGNEIPASIVRWHGASRVEHFIRTLYESAKAADPSALITYVNYPSTEYLQLPFLDLVSFNIYLNASESLAGYLARLLNFVGDRPLLISELGIDSRRKGPLTQARILDRQIRTISLAGCIGSFVFAWTDEWHRGGFSIEDWEFGLTRRDRTPKPALASVAKAFAADITHSVIAWPRISVVVCTYNGQRCIDESLSALERLDYPHYEVIVVDDGSTDKTDEIASRHQVRLIQTEHRGLGSARNTGLGAATGEIVAYIDDDAYPDPDWLKRLALAFQNSEYVGIGGPNIPPPGDSLVAHCVAHAPGGPLHVLLSDREAEHIPGCNMAFRREQLMEIGGFDPQFRTAGDDVDVCWRVQQQGRKLGFCPAATVFHHRRDSLRGYWKQQVGYGKAEAILERKWPDKYNAAGYLTWSGRIYNPKGLTPLWWRRGRIYQGTWGTAGYQRLYQPAANLLGELPLLPEWYLVVSSLGTLSLIGLVWKPLLLTIPLLVLAACLSLTQAALSAASAAAVSAGKGMRMHLKVLGISFILHLIQPVARLCGRFKYGLHPWRHRGAPPEVLPRPKRISIWTEEWRTPEQWLRHLQSRLRSEGTVIAGGGYDDWDLEIQGGMLAAARTRIAVEEHGGGRQMLRFRVWPRCSPLGFFVSALGACISAAAAYDHSWTAASLLFGISVTLGGRILYECALAMHKLVNVLEDFRINDGRESGTVSEPKPESLRAIARNS